MVQNQTGNLLSDAPGLALILREKLSPQGLKAVVEAYAEQADLGSFWEAGVKRDEEVSFNPRPARILKLLVSECEITDADQLVLALKASTLSQDKSPLLPSIIVTQLESKATRDLKNFEDLVGVALLDYFRHLHLCEFSNEDLKAILDDAESVMQNFVKRLNDKIRIKILDALSKQSRRID